MAILAKDAKTKIFYIKIGSFKYAWRAKNDVYPNDIAKILGVVEAKDTEDGLVFGANRPTPPKVRLNLANGRSVLLFCDPGKLEPLLAKSLLNGKKYNGQNINSVDTYSQG